MKHFIAPRYLWEFQTLQKKLIKKGSHDKRAGWLIEYIDSTYIKGKTKVCWPEYINLAAPSLEVPTPQKYGNKERA